MCIGIRKISICSRCICNISTVSGLLLQLLLKMCLRVGAFFRSLLLFHLVVCILYTICFFIHLHDDYQSTIRKRIVWGICMFNCITLAAFFMFYSVSKSLKTLKQFFSIKSFGSTKYLSYVITHLFFQEIS